MKVGFISIISIKSQNLSMKINKLIIVICLKGVRALLIDKDKNPKWFPSTLEDVKNSIIAKYFEPLPNGKELEL